MVLFSVLFTAFPRPAHAGFLSSIRRFLIGSTASAEESSAAVVSLPLLGSESIPPPAVGGPADNSSPSLAVTQDSALVASRNPAGTLPGHSPDQILIYTVQPDDTPGSIAEGFGITLNTLLWANNFKTPHLIKVGDELVILPVSGVRYDVKKGDTIESIAKKFKGDMGDILNFNGLAVGEPLEVGITIIIPDGEFAAPPTPAAGVSRLAGLPEYRGYYMRPIFGGRKTRGIHGFNGVDLAAPCGEAVLASAEGTVIITRPSGWNGGYGKYAVISHPNGTQTLYAHLQTILARVGQRIVQGSQIAAIGSTGNSTGCHVHFEVRGARNPF